MPVESVLSQLSTEVRDILSRTRLVRRDALPVLASSGHAPLLSFRDAGDEPVAFFHLAEKSETAATDVTRALQALLESIYDDSVVRGIHWAAPSLTILDNRRFLHGRAFGSGGPGAAKRHLKRIRVRDRTS
jgi:hypothetical protein